MQQAGIEIQQAEAIALVIKDSQGDLATKSDLEQFRSESKSDLERFKSEFKFEFEQVRSDILWLKWSMAVMMAVMLGGFGTIVSLLP